MNGKYEKRINCNFIYINNLKKVKMKKVIFGAILMSGIVAGYVFLTSMSAAPKPSRQWIWITTKGETVFDPCPTATGNANCPGY